MGSGTLRIPIGRAKRKRAAFPPAFLSAQAQFFGHMLCIHLTRHIVTGFGNSCWKENAKLPAVRRSRSESWRGILEDTSLCSTKSKDYETKTGVGMEAQPHLLQAAWQSMGLLHGGKEPTCVWF